MTIHYKGYLIVYSVVSLTWKVYINENPIGTSSIKRAMKLIDDAIEGNKLLENMK